MKPLLFIVLFTHTSLLMTAQDTWTVTHNKKSVLKKAGENKAKNVITVKKASLTKKGSLVIQFHNTPKESIRSIKIFDAADQNELLTKEDRTELSLTNAELAALFGSASQLHVYTVMIPRDPKLAATVRVRRVHVCTINLK